MSVSAPYSMQVSRPKIKQARFEMRLSPAAEIILDALSEGEGQPRAYIVETALRDLADKKGIEYPGSEIRTRRTPRTGV